MWNPFNKKTVAINDSDAKVIDEAEVKTPKMGMLQAIAMKKMAKMSPQERNKMMQDAMKPENKDKMLAAIEQMKKMGMASEEQIAQAKKMLGL